MAARSGARGVRRNRRPARAFQLNSACAIMPSQAEARSPSSSSVLVRFVRRGGAFGRRLAAEAASKGDSRRGGGAVHEAGDQQRQAVQRVAHDPRRRAQQRIAEHAAQAGRQRPGADARQRGDETGGEERGEDPQQAAPFVAERPMRQQPPAELDFRRQQHDGGEAEQLHRQIGEDRAGEAEQVAHRRLRRVAERGILHRPGGERDGGEERQRDQRQSGELAQAPPQDVAEVLGDESNGVEAAVDRGHLSLPHPRTATRRCSASAVVALSCTMATRI